MKLVLILSLFVFASTTTGNTISQVFGSIEDFKVKHPDAKLIKLAAEDHEYDGSRSYYLGVRQTGKHFRFLLRFENEEIKY